MAKLSKVKSIRPKVAADDIPRALRAIAKEIERGDYDLLTSAVLVVGHTEEHRESNNFSIVGERYTVFGIGPRHDPFTVRGLLASAMMDLNGTPTEDQDSSE